ncbi:MAG: hypothetical protein J6U54_11730 [Clostridiales bacterium]|nr:hypothetical protein [Clostridiales bacterium]
MSAIAMNELEKKDQEFIVSSTQTKISTKCRRCSHDSGQLVYHWIKDGDSDIKMYRVRCVNCGHMTTAHRSSDLAIRVWAAEWSTK